MSKNPHSAAGSRRVIVGECVVCGCKMTAISGNPPTCCGNCRDAGVLWAAKQAHAAAQPPPPVVCQHDWLQNRAGHYCSKCGVQK